MALMNIHVHVVCIWFTLFFNTALIQNLIIMHFPIYLMQKVVHITWLGLMLIMFVFWSLPKKKSFIKYKYTIMIAGTYYVDHIPGTECELNLIKIPKKERIKKKYSGQHWERNTSYPLALPISLSHLTCFAIHWKQTVVQLCFYFINHLNLLPSFRVF